MLVAMAAHPAAGAASALRPADRIALNRIRNAQDKAQLTQLLSGAGASDREVRSTRLDKHTAS